MRTVLLAIGAVLAAIGIFFLLAGGVSFDTHTNLVHNSSVQITRETTRQFALPKAISVLAIIAGGSLIVTGLRRR